MRVSQKLAAANIAVIIVLVVLFLSLSYNANKTLLSGAMNGVDEEAMESLADVLSGYYRKEGSWQGLVDSPQLWDQMVDKEFFRIFFAMNQQAADGMPGENSPPPQSASMQLPFGTFLQRLSLIGRDKNVLIPAEISKVDVNVEPIQLDGNTIGWLRVGKIDMDVMPLTKHFFNRQLSLIIWSAILGGLAAITLSFLLSRQITAPIHQLTAAARKIGRRDFSVNIKITSGDELQELAQSFNQVAMDLSRYQAQQEQWLMDISHELRTPLTILLGEISAICDNLTQCDIKAVSSLHEEVLRIKRLVDDLADLSTIHRNGFNLNQEPIDLCHILSGQLPWYTEKLAEKRIQLHCSLPNYSVDVMGDSDRLAQITRNLLENCLRYTQSPGEVWIDLVRQQASALLTVQDSGPGVPSDALPRLFDRLYRSDISRNRATGGAGLGLTISRELVIAHGGLIAADHNDKGGLRIKITFPLAGGCV